MKSFGSEKIYLPTKMNFRGKPISTLTKTGRLTRRNKVPSVSFTNSLTNKIQITNLGSIHNGLTDFNTMKIKVPESYFYNTKPVNTLTLQGDMTLRKGRPSIRLISRNDSSSEGKLPRKIRIALSSSSSSKKVTPKRRGGPFDGSSVSMEKNLYRLTKRSNDKNKQVIFKELNPDQAFDLKYSGVYENVSLVNSGSLGSKSGEMGELEKKIVSEDKVAGKEIEKELIKIQKEVEEVHKDKMKKIKDDVGTILTRLKENRQADAGNKDQYINFMEEQLNQLKRSGDYSPDTLKEIEKIQQLIHYARGFSSLSVMNIGVSINPVVLKKRMIKEDLIHFFTSLATTLSNADQTITNRLQLYNNYWLGLSGFIMQQDFLNPKNKFITFNVKSGVAINADDTNQMLPGEIKMMQYIHETIIVKKQSIAILPIFIKFDKEAKYISFIIYRPFENSIELYNPWPSHSSIFTEAQPEVTEWMNTLANYMNMHNMLKYFHVGSRIEYKFISKRGSLQYFSNLSIDINTYIPDLTGDISRIGSDWSEFWGYVYLLLIFANPGVSSENIKLYMECLFMEYGPDQVEIMQYALHGFHQGITATLKSIGK